MTTNTDKVVAIICARGGSKGLKNKNIQHLHGKPLIARVVGHAKAAKLVDRVFVSTDDKDIADAALSAGAEVPFLRPVELAQDLTTTEQTLQNALEEFERHCSTQFEICVFVTATDIFRKPEWIDEAVRRLNADQSLESAFVGTKTHKNYWEQDDDGNWVRLRDWMSVYSSRQVRRSIYREDTGLACASRARLWREGRRIGDRISIIENEDDFSSIDIHTIEDLKLAEAALKIRESND